MNRLYQFPIWQLEAFYNNFQPDLEKNGIAIKTIDYSMSSMRRLVQELNYLRFQKNLDVTKEEIDTMKFKITVKSKINNG